jgi:hypothetical protein
MRLPLLTHLGHNAPSADEKQLAAIDQPLKLQTADSDIPKLRASFEDGAFQPGFSATFLPRDLYFFLMHCNRNSHRFLIVKILFEALPRRI